MADLEPMHECYDANERHLTADAAEDLWTTELLDAAIDVVAPIMDATAWGDLPDDAPPRTSERYQAADALVALALRTSRSIALVVRAGYCFEALPSIRRLFEAAGHARRVANDLTGQYAENWIRGCGKAGSARSAFSGEDPEAGPLWKLMSGQAHAQFDVHAHFTARLDERRLLHIVSPQRNAGWDNAFLWLTARQLVSVVACLLKVHPAVDQAAFLRVVQRIDVAESRVAEELEQHRSAT